MSRPSLRHRFPPLSASSRVLAFAALTLFALGAALAGSPSTASAQAEGCGPPISVCRTLPVEEGGPPRMPFEQGCPEDHQCVCVPSCPECDDCAAEVCVPGKSEPECKTACDCPSGLGCFDGRCIAGFAPVYCCEGDFCPAGAQCQHRDGEMDRCAPPCVDSLWSCDTAGGDDVACGAGRSCRCTASCPSCEDCGPPVCAPTEAPTPYACNEDRSCANPGDRCVCIPSCPNCKDCRRSLCVPDRCDPPGSSCAERLERVVKKIDRWTQKTNECRRDRDCTFVDTSTGCQGTCGTFIHRRYEKRFDRKLEKLDAKVCEGYAADGCPISTPICLQRVGECQEGRCVGVPSPIFTQR